MTIEDKLKDYILSKYNSIRDFTITTGIPYSTMSSILKRGLRNANIINIMKICKELNISTDALSAGMIVPLEIYNHDSKTVKVEDLIYNLKQSLKESDLTINNEKIDHQDLQLLLLLLDAVTEVIIKNKGRNHD